ncbi:MAG: GNAT family N-acetyltransferase [Reichenbachiella sp.]|uniref:GNAT family N-acetyltransferase n=1 Tax=Reichenbachiella sp. TaxID=2184521 RepID=UPI00326555A4
MNKSTTLNRGFLFKMQQAGSGLEIFAEAVLNVFSKAMGQYKLRRIRPQDDEKVSELIKKILLERGGLGIESLYYDRELSCLSEYYTRDMSRFNVLTYQEEIIGTVGIGRTEQENICEIKKLYLHKDSRHKGLGKVLFNNALTQASRMGYEHCQVTMEIRNESFYSFLLKNGFKELPHTTNNPYEIQLCKSLN